MTEEQPVESEARRNIFFGWRPEAGQSLLTEAIEETTKIVKEMDEELDDKASHWERQTAESIVGQALVKMLGLAIQFYVASRREK